jgi:hypothetical protein
MRTDLKVPFEQKFQAQSLGARWDAAKRTWYVPDGVDASKFLRWVPGVKVSKAVKKVLRRRV